VCEPSKLDKSIEENAKRPSNYELRQQLADADNYGDQKLAGEEILESQIDTPYVVLRLPDVMGDRDTTKRWWFYVLWLEIYQILEEPISIPLHSQNLTTSYVYASDVATVISDIIYGTYGKEIYNQAFNLGFEDGISLLNLLNEMSLILDISVQFQTTEDAVYMLPSVTRGAVNISKAKHLLNYQATYWKDALNDTVKFYKKAFHWFPKEKGQVVEKLLRLVVPEHKRNLVLKSLETRTFQGKTFY
jgi:nucleoside-diphosphate-sugar epimerase